MRRAFLKHGRTRLKPQDYGALRLEILKRDGWRCQICGRAADLQVHHIESRGQLGGDLEQNLITLCSRCHERLHRAR
jgi:5-methylcytosine-specific restriction endonuclease McrA